MNTAVTLTKKPEEEEGTQAHRFSITETVTSVRTVTVHAANKQAARAEVMMLPDNPEKCTQHYSKYVEEITSGA